MHTASNATAAALLTFMAYLLVEECFGRKAHAARQKAGPATMLTQDRPFLGAPDSIEVDGIPENAKKRRVGTHLP